MVLERPELFSGRERWWFLLACVLFFFLQIGFEYSHYRALTRFDDAIIDAKVRHQYLKHQENRRYHVLKLVSDNGETFYTTGPDSLRHLTGYRLQLRIRTKRLTFIEYLRGFFAYSDILKVYPRRSLRTGMAESIANRHPGTTEGQIYAALFTASPMERLLREKLAALGVSHLLAISGFHLGVLSFVLYMLLKPIALHLQSRCCPYWHRRRMLFVTVALMLFCYLAFLDYAPSLLRAFAMMVVGYGLYDRGLKVLSMQTLAVAVVLLLSLWPRLLFSLGLWLSVGGVYFILLFLHHFGHWHKGVQFVVLHLWVYVMMLPLSLWIFGIFSPLHPLSVLWSMLFILFYPLALLAHVIGVESLLQGILQELLRHAAVMHVSIAGWVVALQLASALGALKSRRGLWLLLGVSMSVFVSAVYQVA